MTLIKSKDDIAALRIGGAYLAEVLATIASEVKPGVNILTLEAIAAKGIADRGCKPAFLGYDGFPNVACLSLNSEVVHGIPRDYELQEGDSIGIDLGLWYDKRCVDAAITVPVGKVSSVTENLLRGTREALRAAVASLKPYRRVGSVGAAVTRVAEEYGLGIIHNLTGHGVGHAIHEEPSVPNDSSEQQGILLRPGMVLAIEPMLTVGPSGAIVTDVDGWTIRTADGTLSAQFEQTVLITDRGAEVLTKLKPNHPLAEYPWLW
jgi:methionyl aminopeptidase